MTPELIEKYARIYCEAASVSSYEVAGISASVSSYEVAGISAVVSAARRDAMDECAKAVDNRKLEEALDSAQFLLNNMSMGESRTVRNITAALTAARKAQGKDTPDAK
jgi:hypothetical protein